MRRDIFLNGRVMRNFGSRLTSSVLPHYYGIGLSRMSRAVTVLGYAIFISFLFCARRPKNLKKVFGNCRILFLLITD